jgi:hypothetical protein
MSSLEARRLNHLESTIRAVSGEQVPVLTALDNAGGVYEAILPSLTTVEAALDGRIAAGLVVCSDGRTAYVKAAVTAGAEHRRWWCRPSRLRR